MPKQILETSRLILREMSPDDLDFVAAMLADAEVMRYYPKCYSAKRLGFGSSGKCAAMRGMATACGWRSTKRPASRWGRSDC